MRLKSNQQILKKQFFLITKINLYGYKTKICTT
jgi:hypothetical protein